MQGMMSPQQAMPEQGAIAPQSGMMAPQPQPNMSVNPAQKFNGTIMYEGEPVKVVDSKAEIDGETYLFSADGRLMVSREGILMGIVQDGNLIPPPQELIAQMKQTGAIT